MIVMQSVLLGRAGVAIPGALEVVDSLLEAELFARKQPSCRDIEHEARKHALGGPYSSACMNDSCPVAAPARPPLALYGLCRPLRLIAALASLFCRSHKPRAFRRVGLHAPKKEMRAVPGRSLPLRRKREAAQRPVVAPRSKACSGNVTGHAPVKGAALSTEMSAQDVRLSKIPFGREPFGHPVASFRGKLGERNSHAYPRRAAALVTLRSLWWRVATQTD